VVGGSHTVVTKGRSGAPARGRSGWPLGIRMEPL
jgi:hypothetical protein